MTETLSIARIAGLLIWVAANAPVFFAGWLYRKRIRSYNKPNLKLYYVLNKTFMGYFFVLLIGNSVGIVLANTVDRLNAPPGFGQLAAMGIITVISLVVYVTTTHLNNSRALRLLELLQFEEGTVLVPIKDYQIDEDITISAGIGLYFLYEINDWEYVVFDLFDRHQKLRLGAEVRIELSQVLNMMQDRKYNPQLAEKFKLAPQT